MRVLVVDDSAAVRSRLVEMIGEQSSSIEVVGVADGDEALRALERDTYDVVVLDLHLPGTSGLAVLASIPREAGRPRLLVLTNDATEQHRRQCAALGADEFFDKSTEFDRVVTLMGELAAQ
jgi:DNA-binding NarL/FixJ family response regulator